MAIARLSDSDIQQFIEEKKPLPIGFRDMLIGRKMKTDDAHKRSELSVEGINGNHFQIKVRISNVNPFNFSAILVFEFPDTTGTFILRRYNGNSHYHTNKIEGETIHGFHIHYATQRYQEHGFSEDAYAEKTTRYSDLNGAFNCLILDCNFILPEGEQLTLL